MELRDACPSEHALLDAIIEHQLADLAEHLDECDECREVVAELARHERTTVGRFEIEQVLGSGATGIVYLARDPQLERRVALKILHVPSAGRLLEEARVLASLESDHLVRVYELEEVDGQLAIAMEYLPGGTLRTWLATPRSWREIVTVMIGVAKGLATIHAADLLHRDLKPENILFDTTGRARIADLGLAGLRGTARAAGTPAYMAPEVLAGGAAGDRSDQYSFFVCLYEALTGVRPRGEAIALPGPRALQAIITRGLDREPSRRHDSVNQVVHALERVLRSRRTWLVVPAAGAAALAVALASSSSQDACARAGEPVTTVWGDSARAQLSAAYHTHDMAISGSLVIRGLDEVAAAWASAQIDSCRGTHERHDQSDELLDRRTMCLRAQLAAFETVVTQLVQAGREQLARGAEAVAALPDAEACAAPRLVGNVRNPDPRAAAARDELARLRAMRSLGEGRRSIPMTAPLISLGAELGDHALVAEATLVRADALADDDQLEGARAAFADTELAAEVARDDDLRARALLAHATLVGWKQQQPTEGAQLLRRARAVIERLDGRADLRRRLGVAEAAVAAARGDQRVGEQRLREVLATMPSTGSERATRVIALRDLANMVFEQGRVEEAARAAREAAAFAEATFGPDHVEVSESLSLLALTLHHAGEHEREARQLATRALAIKERARGPNHVSLSSTLMVQALIARDATTPTGHAEARRFTDRAIALRRTAYGDANPLVLSLVSERGSLAVDAGEYEIARVCFAEAIPGLVRAWGAASPAVTNARESQATMAEQAGDAVGCAAALAQIPDPSEDTLLHRARCLIEARDHVGAAQVLDGLSVRVLDAPMLSSRDLLAARIALARGDRGRARDLLAAADTRLPTPAPDLALDLAETWAQLGDHRRAAILARRAVSNMGDDLASATLYGRAAKIALHDPRSTEGERWRARSVEIAKEAAAGPDLLGRLQAVRSK